jgi:hypothetical protein
MLYIIAFISNVGLMKSGPSLFEQSLFKMHTKTFVLNVLKKKVVYMGVDKTFHDYT